MNFAGEKKHTTSPVYVGSSVIGMKFRDGVIIACDTRINYGSIAKFQNIDDRIQRINANTMISSSGEYSDFQEVVRFLKETALSDVLGKRSYLGPEEITNYLSSMHYYKRNKMNPYWNHSVTGGLSWEGKPVLYSVDQYGTLLKSDYMLVGMAIYFCNSIIEPEYPLNYEDLSQEDALNILRKCFKVLFYRDTRAGNKIKFSIMKNNNGSVTYDEVFEELQTEWDYQRFRYQANEKIY
jgi:20S proteasome subunit beta 7